MKNKKNSEWFLGLDIGTDSVGWAVTDENYTIQKFKGNAMWGAMLFDAANQSADRRAFRTARRRLDRRQQRVLLLQQLFADEIAKKDEDFCVRLKESALYPEDKSIKGANIFFNDSDFTDKNYNDKYPTIHHLVFELMNNKAAHDVRLVYLACAYLLAHRGHFLIDVDKDNIDGVTDFDTVYQQVMDWFVSMELNVPWECESLLFADIMKKKTTMSNKEKKFKELLWGGKKPAMLTDYPVSPECVISMLCGRKTELSKLFLNDEYKELENNSLCIASADFDDILDTLSPEMNDGDADLLARLKALYDWSLLTEILDGEKYISAAKVKTYSRHNDDLQFLKHIIKSYAPDKYDEVFRSALEKVNNYTSYSYNISSVKGETPEKFKKCNTEEFCKYIQSIVKDITVNDCDKEKYDDMVARLSLNSFCPKQVNTDNRVIPYQLYWIELKIILDNASEYLDFLNISDEYGSVSKKILSLMEFRIPYYVGPLAARKSDDNFWMKRKNDGKIYPWNFDYMVDKDASEQEFIRRMTCKCTYLAGKDVLAKNSLLYSKFTVLNEINNIKINDVPISVNCKQRIYEDLFMQRRNVTVSALKKYLLSNGYMKADEEISGIDISVKSNLKSYHDFKQLLTSKTLTENDAEKIIERITFTDDKLRLKKWLNDNYSLSNDDIKYLSHLKYSDFGRLSAELLTEICDVDSDSGEIINPNLITILWESNENLMQLLSDRYSYSKQIAKANSEYYQANPTTIQKRLDEMYVSNAVKRPILRTLDVVKELGSIMDKQPKKIFVEMARGEKENKKGKRTISRRDQIKDLYKKYDKEEIQQLTSELESKSDGELRSEKIFLYFMQLGKCMYSGKTIDIEKIGTKEYDIDHIYPQSRIKDDSIDNKVLVLSELNGQKKDIYPIAEDIRRKMYGFWEGLYEKNLISETKRKRLERNTVFTDDELANFISRQLVETRQSTKAIAELLTEMYPNSEIVYVKAGLVSEFRHQFDMLKCREINDLHHAKDAYLNIVMGNVYNVKYTRNPMNFIKCGEKYTLNLPRLLEHDIERGGVCAWKNGETLDHVKKTMAKNNIRSVKYTYKRKGGFYHQNPERASDKGDSLAQIKSGLDTSKYGGYNNLTATFFCPVKYFTQNTDGIVIIPIDLLYARQFGVDKEFAKEYCMKVVSDIVSLKSNDVLSNVEFPLGKRIIKINTALEIDGFRCLIAQKSNKGRTLVLSSLNPLVVDGATNEYIKALASFAEKSERGRLFSIEDGNKIISSDGNLKLYDYLHDKLTVRPYNVMFSKVSEKLASGRAAFERLSVTEQSLVLLNIVNILKTGRSAGCDLTKIGDVSKAAIITLNSDLSKLKGFKSICLVDQSPTGLFERKSPNLLEL